MNPFNLKGLCNLLSQLENLTINQIQKFMQLGPSVGISIQKPNGIGLDVWIFHIFKLIQGWGKEIEYLFVNFTFSSRLKSKKSGDGQVLKLKV